MSRTANEIRVEWQRRKVAAPVSDMGATLDFHEKALQSYDGALSMGKSQLSLIPVSDLKPEVASARIDAVNALTVDNFSKALLSKVGEFEAILVLYKDRQTQRLVEQVRPTNPAEQAGYQIRVESIRNQLAALPMGPRFQAAWDAVNQGRGDVIEAAELSLVPLFDTDMLGKLKDAYKDAATPEERKNREVAEDMLAEVRRLAGMAPYALRAALLAFTNNNFKG